MGPCSLIAWVGVGAGVGVGVYAWEGGGNWGIFVVFIKFTRSSHRAL